VEVPGLWKAWKAKSRLPPLSTSPLEISPRAGEIPTFPQRRRRGRWKSGKPKAGFPLSHRPDSSSSQNQKAKPGGGLRPPPVRSRRPSGADFSQTRPPKGDIAQQPHFQAHLALESESCFRLIAHWNQFLISGSFVDWKMLPRTGLKCTAYGTVCELRSMPNGRIRAVTPAISGAYSMVWCTGRKETRCALLHTIFSASCSAL